MKYALLLIVSLAAAVACVSAKMGESNLEAVNALADLAVKADPANAPLAEKASADAAALADSTGTTEQITHLGVPNDLAEQNHANIQNLISKVDTTKPEIKAVVDAALKTDQSIAGRTHAAASFKAAAHSTPWTDTLLNAIEMFGAGVGTIYAGTRGQKHVRRWWNTPGTPVPAPVNSNTAATSTPPTTPSSA